MADESEDIEASTTSTTHSNSSQPQLLQVTPKDLYFPPPYNRDVSATIVLHNSTAEPVTYKIKTTAPKRYIVRPPLGICPPGSTIEVAVSLTYHKEPPTQPEKGDKFQVQAFALQNLPEAATQDSLKEIWRGKPAVTKTKIAAHFSEPPATATPAATQAVPASTNSASPVVAAEPTAAAPVATKPTAVSEPVAAITSQSHPPKPRTETNGPHTVGSPKLAPFDNHVDPVSTVAPSSPSNTLIPLIIAFLLGLLLGYFVGVYYGSTERIVYEVASTASGASKGKL